MLEKILKYSFAEPAMDGTIKIWYYETIELADPPEEEKFIEVEPIFEFQIGDYYHKAELMVIVKSDPDSNSTIWFGQVSRSTGDKAVIHRWV